MKQRDAGGAIPERELIDMLINRQQAGMGMLYDNYSAALYGVIIRLVHVRELAEDLLQETFMKVWNNIDAYDESKGRLFTWMVRIARNLALDAIKSKGFRASLQNQEFESLVPQIEGQFIAGDESDHIGIQELVQGLRPEQEELIALIFYQGYTHAEASEKLGIPLGTVKTRVRAAINRIRTFFE